MADVPAQSHADALPSAATSTFSQRARGYWEMTRPSVVALVFFTAVPMLALETGRWPALVPSVVLLLGIAAIAGASSVFNAYIERETDKRMVRTRSRPLPTGLIAPRNALTYAWTLTVIGLAMIAWVGGWFATAVGAATIVFYVYVYTVWLKPRTPLNIVIGGAAGAAPPLIVDAAMNGRIGLMSFTLFALVFLWTPPHFWAIALFRKNEYGRAGFPMLPLTHGDEHTRQRIVAYALSMIPVALLPTLFGHLSIGYAVVSLLVCAWFVWVCVDLWRVKTNKAARRTMLASLVQLHLVFTAMTVDLLI